MASALSHTVTAFTLLSLRERQVEVALPTTNDTKLGVTGRLPRHLSHSDCSDYLFR
jgi:hypothetical protein